MVMTRSNNRCAATVLAACLCSTAAAAEVSSFDCLIKPYLVADVSTREQGIVDSFLVERGDLIEKGQVLVQLDAEVEQAAVELARGQTEMQAEIEEKRTSLDYAKRQFERIDELYRKKGTSFNDRDEASTEALRAELQLRQAEQRQQVAKLELQRATRLLERRTIHSPITGVVLERMLSPGESVEDRPIIRVAQINLVNVEVILPVDHFGAIKKGMQAEVMPKYPGATAHTATVTVVDRVVDAASNTFGVRLELPNPDLEIPGGVRCSVSFKEQSG
jgi:RND family efflux transporter MFP subunit